MIGQYLATIARAGYCEAMKLYLSSLGVPNVTAYKNLFGRPNPRIGLIANAWDVAPKAISQPYVKKTSNQLQAAGGGVVPIDLLKNPSFTDLDGLWFMGGNTFYLNWAIHQTDLLKFLKQVKGNFVFAGESAGAVIAGTTLHGIEFLDDPKEAPQVIWEGLGLVDYGIIPHWGTPDDQAALQKAYAEMSRLSQVKLLADKDFIVA